MRVIQFIIYIVINVFMWKVGVISVDTMWICIVLSGLWLNLNV